MTVLVIRHERIFAMTIQKISMEIGNVFPSLVTRDGGLVMRVIMFVQVAAVAFLLSGCPGAPASDPTGGGKCVPPENCSSTGESTGGQGGGVGTGGKGGSGNAGVGGSGNASSSGGAGGAGNGAGGAGGTGSSTGGSGQGGSGGGGAMVCDPLLMDLTVKEDLAKVCYTESAPATQCQYTIDGICCPIAVTDENSPEVLAYKEALKQYLMNGCMPSCPPDPCPAGSKPSCMSTPGSSGTCVLP